MKHRHRWFIGGLAAMVLAGLALIAPGEEGAIAEGGILYVDADALAGGGGMSWADAFTTLQPALDAAGAGTQIWVAEGTYKPTQLFIEGDPRSAAFQMVNGVEIYGGFAGTEEYLADRDWVTNVTALSGDIGSEGDSADNSYHVFYHPSGLGLDDSAVLDGFTITGGNADGGEYADRFGAGMHNDGSSPNLANCTFLDNSSLDSGGGMWNINNSSPVLTGCTFAGNLAGWGGGMVNYTSSSPTLTSCTFAGNSALEDGGGLWNYDDSSPLLTDCTFSGNSAGRGGGIYNQSSVPTLVNCTFSGNTAVYGAGMYNESSLPTLANCTFSGNSASQGGGMSNIFSSPTLINCSFQGNSATQGGGMFNGDSSPTLTNCTFSGNSASQGGGMSNFYSWPTLTNCILWSDTSPEIYNSSFSSPIVTYSDIQGGYTGDGNIDADPLFVDPAIWDFHLGEGSPCIDVGSNAAPYLPEYDFEGDDRVLDGDGDEIAIVDMGVDEVVPPVVEVEIDVRPGSEQNPINLGSRGVIPVAILTTEEFDASTVKPASVWFAGAAPKRWTREDVDGDGDEDLLLHFRIQELELDEGSTAATLMGETFSWAGGMAIEGTDAVRIVP